MINIFNYFKKNKYKILVIFVVLFFVGFFGLWNIVSEGYDRQNKTILFIKKFIPSKLARQVRDTIFIIPDLKERNKFLELVMQKYDQGLNGNVFNEKIILSKKNKKKYLFKEFFIPFERLDLRLGWASTTNTLRKHYFDIINDKILLISGNGKSIYFDKKNVFEKRLNQKNIPNNISSIINNNNYEPMGIRDVYIENDKIYISLYFKTADRYSMNIYSADLNFNKLNFEIFFKSNLFWNKWTTRTGGRIEKYKDNKILLTLGDGATKGASQDLESLLGKIISIDKTTKKYEIVSVGHRNPQGLYYFENLDMIINTEHGPKGGDEININLQNSDKIANFGWDVSSYGTPYSGKDIYKKSHSEYGFIEPFKNYSPAIGISQIILMSDKSEENNKYFYVSSLRASSLYVIKTNNKITKILNEDRIYFNEKRIRDIKYDEDEDMLFLIFDNIPSFGTLKLN
tara:strand:- start:104 stop:1474 length:1371 start_codon:yes stop_codon:yes gene_type:complete